MSESERGVEEVMAGGEGAGDKIDLPLPIKKDITEESDPDKIVSLGVVEEMVNEKRNGQDVVYRACSVNTTSDGLSLEMGKNANGDQRRRFQEEPPEKVASSWSITKLFRRFSCCKDDGDADSDAGIELDNLCPDEIQEPCGVDVVDGIASRTALITNDIPGFRVTCSMGPVMTVDCSKFSVDEEMERLKSSLGDAIRKLIIRNPPINSAVTIFSEPLLTENVTSLHLENCDVTVRHLCLFLGNLKFLEHLNIDIKAVMEGGSSVLKDDYINSSGSKEYFSNQRSELFPSTGELPRGLKVLTISVPMTWQCSLICQTVEAMLIDSRLEEINLKSSLKEMIAHLVSSDVINFDDEKTWHGQITLNARGLLQKSSSTLKHLTISCADTFPLEYLKISKASVVDIDDVYKWCYFCTYGVLSSIVTFDGGMDVNKNTHLELPKLTNLYLDLPSVPVPMARDDELRQPLNAVAEFLARNNGIHVVTLHGLRPVKGMENWMKNSLVTIPKYRMSIGCTYTSATLASNMPTFDDELGSMGLEITADEERQRVTEIIDPHGLEVIPHTWRYTGMKCFHLVNQLRSLVSYDLDRIASKFSKLTKLAIEDYTTAQDQHAKTDLVVRSLTDLDMQTIFQKLVCLEYLHLDCNMKGMTDRGLTGITDSLWSRLTQRDKMFSFWYLYNLKYLYLKGLGEQVTDKSAVYAFSEEYSLKKLQQLHVFAPGFTNYGREKIRRAYTGRNGFILQL